MRESNRRPQADWHGGYDTDTSAWVDRVAARGQPAAIRSLVACALLAAVNLAAQPWPLQQNCTLTVATRDQASALLTTRDDFVRALSPFDRAARLKSEKPVDEPRFLAFVSAQALDWAPADIEKLGTLSTATAKRLAGWNLPFPATIQLIKTTGLEEGGAAYTRGTAIILPAQQLTKPADDLQRLLLHEMFHVLSRANPDLREALYAIIGFHPAPVMPLPGDLEPRRITNPDAPVSRHFIQVKVSERPFHLIPILFSKVLTYPADPGGEFFRYLEFKLMAIEQTPSGWRPTLADGRPRLFNPADTTGFFEQVGRNTQYLYHPDEILADNFALLILGKTSVPTPQLLDTLQTTLRKFEHPAAP